MEFSKFLKNIQSKDNPSKVRDRDTHNESVQEYNISRYLTNLIVTIICFIILKTVINPLTRYSIDLISDYNYLIITKESVIIMYESVLYIINTVATLLLIIELIPFELIRLKSEYKKALTNLTKCPGNKYVQNRVIEAGVIYYSSFHKDGQLTLNDKESIKRDIIEYRFHKWINK